MKLDIYWKIILHLRSWPIKRESERKELLSAGFSTIPFEEKNHSFTSEFCGGYINN